MLPFDNLSNDPEMQFFSDGVSEEIIQRLSRGAKLKVIGRTSSFQFRGADKTREVAKELKCSHMLDGSIRRAGGRVRIAAHLVEAASQTTLWSDRYDRSLEDIFAVQDEISEHIAGRARPDVHELLDQGDRSGGLRPLSARQPQVLCARRAAHQRRPAGGRHAARPAISRRPGVGSPICGPGCASISRLPIAPRAPPWWRAKRSARLALDPQNVDALTAQFFVIPPFGRFVEADAVVERIARAPGLGAGGNLRRLVLPDDRTASRKRRGDGARLSHWTR